MARQISFVTIFFFPSRSDQETGRTETRVGRSDTVNNVEISKPCFFQVSRYERRVNYPCRLNSRGEGEKKKRLCIFMKALQWC